MKARALLSRAWLYRGDLAFICLGSLLTSAAILTVPWLSGELLNGLLDDAGASVGQTLAVLIFALLILTGFSVVNSILSSRAAGRILAATRMDIYAHVQKLPVRDHEQAQLSDLLALMTSEAKVLSTFLATTLATVPSNIATAIGAIVLLLMLDPVLALVVPVIIPVFLIIFRLVGKRLRRLAGQARKADVDVFSKAERDLDMLPAIKSFAQEQSFRQNYADAVETARRANLRHARLASVAGPVTGLLAALVAIAILFIGTQGLAGMEAKNAGELFSFLLYAALLTRPASGLARLYGEFQWVTGTLERMSEVLDLSPEEGYSKSAAPETKAAKGEIAFQNIHFSYPGRETLLEGIDLTIASGEVVALTGPNGAGKSTLVRLLLRFYEPQSGRVLLDGQDIRDLNVQYLRGQIGYVPQRPLLFEGTVKQNITMGAEQADSTRIERACRLSGALEFIQSLPDGLETLIGDNGVRLSGGQRQRIALARALYFDPPIFIFDEATSMYDMPSEAAFVETCIEALGGRTMIIITHRPATLALADRVLEAAGSGYRVVEARRLPPSGTDLDCD